MFQSSWRKTSDSKMSPITTEQLEKVAFLEFSEPHKNTNVDVRAESSELHLSVQNKQAEKTAAEVFFVFSCRRCSKPLFTSSDLEKAHKKGKSLTIESQIHEEVSGTKDCSSFYLQHVPWGVDLSAYEGKLSCPKCQCRVGSYSWYGEKCSCGLWVTPALKVSKRKVDQKL
eukprot:jgi/Galph1/1082/GphlegSOOS_G5784.1